jgi:hypothetical protein
MEPLNHLTFQQGIALKAVQTIDDWKATHAVHTVVDDVAVLGAKVVRFKTCQDCEARYIVRVD